MRKDLETRRTLYAVLALALLAGVGTTAATGQSASERSGAGMAGQLSMADMPHSAFVDAIGKPQAFGTQDPSIAVVSGLMPAFNQSSGQQVEYTTDLHGWVWKTGGTVNLHDFVAPVSLPAGARLQAVGIEACDFNSPGSIVLTLRRCPLGGDCTSLGSISTGTGATPGCDFFFFNLSTPETINHNFHYNVLVTNAGSTSQTRFRKILVQWRRQLSPAPGTATFDDVPTGHLFFQQIEALAASGITGGCGGDNFCPSEPLTRGQMAAFLAKALGLHWPN